jgi:hypothetical protein
LYACSAGVAAVGLDEEGEAAAELAAEPPFAGDESPPPQPASSMAATAAATNGVALPGNLEICADSLLDNRSIFMFLSPFFESTLNTTA